MQGHHCKEGTKRDMARSDVYPECTMDRKC